MSVLAVLIAKNAENIALGYWILDCATFFSQ